MAEHIVASDQLMVPIAHFSHGARVARRSMSAPRRCDRDRRLAGTSVGVRDMPAQRNSLANLGLELEALGGKWQDVVKVKTYIVDWRDLPAYDAVHDRELGALRPAVAKVGTWGIPLPQILLETELVPCLVGTEHSGRPQVARRGFTSAPRRRHARRPTRARSRRRRCGASPERSTRRGCGCRTS